MKDLDVVNNSGLASLTLADMGVEQEIVDNLWPAKGLILSTGPTGSGKSNLVLAFARHLGHLQGEDARGLMVGEIRDPVGMLEASTLASGGILVFGTMHTLSVSTTVNRILQFFAQDRQYERACEVMSSIHMIIGQILAPRIGGGQIALREFLILDDQAKAVFRSLTDVNDWGDAVRSMLQDGTVVGRSLVESGRAAYAAGLISDETLEPLFDLGIKAPRPL